MEKKEWRNILRLVLTALGAAAFLAVCALSATPLLRYQVGQDAAFFRLVGQGMTQGLLPYRDYFDMKGPYLFLMEYLGQLCIPGRGGVFLLECICLTVTAFFGVKCWDLANDGMLLPIWAELMLLLPAGYVLSFTMTGGNLTEELSLPFLMPCLYLFLRYLRRTEEASPESQDHPVGAGFCYGVVFGVMAMIRVTNGALVGAILLTATGNLLAHRRFRNLLANAGAFLLGVLAGIFPAVCWCASQGILRQMLEQVFLFGFRYSGESGLLESFSTMGDVRTCLALLLIPGVPLVTFGLWDWKLWLFFASSAVTVLVAALMGNGYCHYFVLAIPNLVYGGFLTVYGIRRKSSHRGRRGEKALLLSALLTMVLLAFPWKLFQTRAFEEIRYSMYCARFGIEERQEYDGAQQLLRCIPQEERDRVYVYGLPSCSAWYLQAGLQPPMRYCDWQPHYIQLVPEIGTEIVNFLESDSSLWVVTGQDVPEPERIGKLLQRQYEIIARAENLCLWKKR